MEPLWRKRCLPLTTLLRGPSLSGLNYCMITHRIHRYTGYRILQATQGSCSGGMCLAVIVSSGLSKCVFQVFYNVHAAPFVPGAAEHPSPDRAVVAAAGSGPSSPGIPGGWLATPDASSRGTPPVITLSDSDSDPLSPVRPVYSPGAGVPLDDTPPKLVCNSPWTCYS